MWTRTRALPPATGSVRSRRSCSSSRAKSSPTRSSGRFRRPNSERSWTLSPDTPRGGDRISTSGIGIPSLSPTRDEFRALAAQGNLVPVFAELPADLDTPLSAYLRLRRSEEHTSELQSPCNLVCRLLLEKKKRRTKTMYLFVPTHRVDELGCTRIA